MGRGQESMTLAVNDSARVVLGTPIHALTMTETLDLVDKVIATNSRLRIGVVNAAKIVNMRRDPMLHDDVVSSDLILPDGMAVVWAARLLGYFLPERVAGIDLMLGMLTRANQHGHRVYCLGANQEVLEKVTARITQEYPSVNIVGSHNGYFTQAEEANVAADIAAAHPHILFVAITSPKKEQFIARWSNQLGVPICHGVGGSFDVLAGKVDRAPELWQRLGLEWLYRVKQEPGRLWRRYLVTNTLFCSLVVKELLRQLTGTAAR
jgi:N-acetylglucosaminyldiphosphoundecaprenol N-acetyl-beta-D-mannosaminyltransferase